MKTVDSNTSCGGKTDIELKPPAELLKMFMAHTVAAVAMCDTRMRYLAYSRTWAEDYGLGDDNLVGRCHYDLFPDLPEHWKDEHQRCFGGEIIKKAEEPFAQLPMERRTGFEGSCAPGATPPVISAVL